MDDHIAGTPEEAWRDNAERRYREGYLEGAIYGTANERERIIALLDNYTMYRFEKDWVVALINGEEK